MRVWTVCWWEGKFKWYSWLDSMLGIALFGWWVFFRLFNEVMSGEVVSLMAVTLKVFLEGRLFLRGYIFIKQDILYETSYVLFQDCIWLAAMKMRTAISGTLLKINAVMSSILILFASYYPDAMRHGNAITNHSLHRG